MEPKHAGLGIASFVISIVAGCGLFGLLVIAGVMESSTPGGINEEAPVAVFLGLLILGGLFASFVGFILGIAGLMQKNRKKVFGVLGTIFNGVIVLGTLCILLIGLAMG